MKPPMASGRMGGDLYNCFFLFFLLLLSFFSLKAIVFLWWRPRKIQQHFSKQGIRGPPYHFFIGNVREIVGLMLKASSHPMPLTHNILPRVLSFYHHWKKIYGSTYLIWFGPTARLTVADPEIIREVFVSKAEFFEKYESHPVVRQLEGDGLLSLKGEKWAHHRKIITPTFHMENLKLLAPVIGKSVVEMVEKWWSMAESGEVEIEVSDWFHSLTEDVITRTAFGSNYDEGKPVFRLQAQQMVFAAEAFGKVLIPGYRFLPTKKNTISWKLDKEIRNSLVRLIGLRRENSDEDDDRKMTGARAKDLLGLMINAGVKKKTSEKMESCSGCLDCSSSVNNGQGRSATSPLAARTKKTFSVEEMVEECKTFFFAGKQSTSNLLTWTTVLLAMNPEWQKLAREEVLEVCGSRDIPTKDDIAKLKTLGRIVNESLRLYPPVVATIRRAKADVEVGGYKIPCGTELLIPILAVHHDTKIWGRDAADFNPSRFRDPSRHPMGFIPFGVGSRTCIGQNLALMHAKLTVAILLQRFSFRLAPTYRHAPTVLMLLYPQYGAPIIFSRR
ncbi:hypothetical protein AAC387_Pa03g3525 [Persea americana]